MFTWTDLKPNFVILTPDGFVKCGVEIPDTPVFISVEIPAFNFHKTAKYGYKETDDMKDPFRRGKTLWITAMQKNIVSSVRIFTDDIESGLFTAANFQNDPTFPFLFAKLLSCELHDRVMDVFMTHTKRF